MKIARYKAAEENDCEIKRVVAPQNVIIEVIHPPSENRRSKRRSVLQDTSSKKKTKATKKPQHELTIDEMSYVLRQLQRASRGGSDRFKVTM